PIRRPPTVAATSMTGIPSTAGPSPRCGSGSPTPGTRPHPAYQAGMSSLSCRFCVLASRADLVCSARLNPELAQRYAAVEHQTGHRFRLDLSMAEVIAEAQGHGSNDAHDGQLTLLPR
ncbi:hypothetical protein PJH53_29300, partial [Mycobacterium kansasii]